VRQTEGDPILDLAEPFWQTAVGNNTSEMKSMLNSRLSNLEPE
jgi:hypothetical protein